MPNPACFRAASDFLRLSASAGVSTTVSAVSRAWLSTARPEIAAVYFSKSTRSWAACWSIKTRPSSVSSTTYRLPIWPMTRHQFQGLPALAAGAAAVPAAPGNRGAASEAGAGLFLKELPL